ncbi:MAG: hypothetical protein R3189_07225 [Thiomicrorhabdus chilensis]|uniref:DUF4870 family protein n=1 Tax=Thiomicrorhabdus chilensis TaxID=63656 RepID=UPI00299DE1CB|nr:hypothetical protein [Thiomicrorhabdus chilensis]MDX1348024.1 hypothetical protein [Thiomicrorhabdus chilensis]
MTDTENTPGETTQKTQTPPTSTTLPTIIYALYLANLIVPFAALVGVIMAYVNKSDGTDFLESHYQFQIRTFWIGLLYGFIGVLLTFIVIGWLILFFTAIWLIIRCVKGFKYLGKQEPMPEPTSWMFG